MGLSSAAARFTDGGIENDEQKFAAFGVNPLGADSLPYYARWIRQDLIGVYFVLSRIATYARAALVLLVLIAIPLWMIALK